MSCAAWTLSPSERAAIGKTDDKAALGPPLSIGVAGGSALREYERRHAAHERRAHDRAGTVGLWLARLMGEPLSTQWWKQGGEGEMEVAKWLTRLLDGSDVHLLHDRRAPGRIRANIDHVAVGPGGITVIDAKALAGKVRVDVVDGPFGQSQRLRVGGRERTQLVYSVRGQAESVRALLAHHRIESGGVRCALCFANTDGLPWFRRLQIEDVLIDGPRRVAKLARRDGPLRKQEVKAIVHTLTELLPPA